MRNSAICGPDLDNPEEKRDMGKAEQFRQKRRCKSIRAPTEAEIASLEVNITIMFWNLNLERIFFLVVATTLWFTKNLIFDISILSQFFMYVCSGLKKEETMQF